MAEIERWEEVERDLRTDAKGASDAAYAIDHNDGEDKDYGIKVGEARAFQIAADRIAGELEELRYA